MSELVGLDVTAATVARAVHSGRVERLSRGVFRAADARMGQHVDVASAASRVPRGVVCLYSAASIHEMGDETPHEVWMAIGARDHAPRLDWPSIRPVRWRSSKAFDVGVETRVMEGVSVRVTSPARTALDMLRMRTTVGEDRALETLRDFVAAGGSMPEIGALAERLGWSSAVSSYLKAFSYMAVRR